MRTSISFSILARSAGPKAPRPPPTTARRFEQKKPEEKSVMWNRKVFRATVWGLALGLGILAGAAHAEGDGDGPDKQVVKKRGMIVDQDGKQKVYEGDGPAVRRRYLGVALTDLTPALSSHLGV